MPNELYELIERPDLEAPVLALALDGWIDAGMAAETAAATLLDSLDSVTVARFDVDRLIDFRARRPTVHMTEGVMRRLSWPSIELRAVADLDGNEMLMLTGTEPDRSWHRFVDAVVQLALSLEVRMCVGLGAYPAPAPHTRPSRLACCASTPNLATPKFIRGSLDFPGGVQAAVEQACHGQDIPSLALWAQVPHYAAAMPYPPASMALVEGLGQIGGLSLPFGDLPTDSQTTKDRLDELFQQNPEHQGLLQELESSYEQDDIASDTTITEMNLPTGDELAAELERFLRDQ